MKDSTNESLNNTELQIQELEKARIHYGDELEKADEKITVMNSEMNQLKNMRSEFEDTIKLQKERLDTRDREIERLNSLHTAGSNIDHLNQAYNTELSRTNIEKLNNQIDFLNKQNQKMEEDLKSKNEILSTSEKYKADRIAMGKKYTDLIKDNKKLLEDIHAMENVIQELKDKVNENSSVMVKKKYVPLADLNGEKDKRVKAEDQMKKLENEIRQYKRADDFSQDQLKKVESEVRTLNKNLEDLIKENLDLNNRVDDHMNDIRRIKNEKEQSQQDTEYYQNKYKQMEQNYHQYKKMNIEVSQEKELTEEGRIKNQEKVINLENELSEALRLHSEVKYELERMKRQHEYNESELEEYRQRATNYKNQADNNSTTLNRVQIKSETALKQLEVSGRERMYLQEEIDKKSKEIIQLEKELKSLKYEFESSQDSKEIMRSEHKMLSDELTNVLKDLEMEKRRIRELERESSEYKHIKTKLEGFEEGFENIISKKSNIEKDNAKNMNRIIELENLLKIKEKVLEENDRKYQEVCIRQSESDRKEMKDDTQWQVIQQYKEEIEDKQRVIHEQRLKETENLERVESQQVEIKKLKYDIDLERDRVKNIKETKEKVDFELREARRNVTDLDDRLNSDRNSNIITEQQKNQATMEVSDLQNQIQNLKKDKHNLDEDNSESRKNVEELQ